MLDFGSQNAWGDFKLSDLREVMTVFGTSVSDDRLLAHTKPGIKVEHLMRDAGFRYAAFDVYSRGSTRIFDLNADTLGWRDRGHYDVVTKFLDLPTIATALRHSPI